MTKLELVHTIGEHIDVRFGDVVLARYVYASPSSPHESPKPYVHPLRTLAGDVVTGFRPHDHPWHKALQMTATLLSGQNFWGGSTYVRDRGYVHLPNVGSVVHCEWECLATDGERAELVETLEWRTAEGRRWLAERRRLEACYVDQADRSWVFVLDFELENVAGRTLSFGSPTTEGRPQAGYGGLVWRGPRSFAGGAVLGAGGLRGDELMGARAEWLAFVGRHDEVDRSSTLVFVDNPGNPRFPNRWFVRSEPFAFVSFSFVFDETLQLSAGDTLRLSYAIVVGDGAWDAGRIDRYVATMPRQLTRV